MLYKVFDLADKEVSDAGLRPEVVAIDLTAGRRGLKAVLESPPHPLPVYRETLDDIVGVLHRDLIEAMRPRISYRRPRVTRAPYYVVPRRRIWALLTVPAHEPALAVVIGSTARWKAS
jgi:Mg2+/Co2+ transporter CorB